MHGAHFVLFLTNVPPLRDIFCSLIYPKFHKNRLSILREVGPGVVDGQGIVLAIRVGVAPSSGPNWLQMAPAEALEGSSKRKLGSVLSRNWLEIFVLSLKLEEVEIFLNASIISFENVLTAGVRGMELGPILQRSSERLKLSEWEVERVDNL